MNNFDQRDRDVLLKFMKDNAEVRRIGKRGWYICAGHVNYLYTDGSVRSKASREGWEGVVSSYWRTKELAIQYLKLWVDLHGGKTVLKAPLIFDIEHKVLRPGMNGKYIR